MIPTDTNQLILETEEKVALQWANASGNSLTHSGGFSFRRTGTTPYSAPDSTPCKALSPVASSTLRVVRPTRARAKPNSVLGSSVAFALLILLFLGLGVGYAAQTALLAEPEATAPLMW